ncbi:hypothetical protein BH10CYA1_BH10CYA1_63700 [soil metagenome]
MREHQIVINLKPDQFEEVQRMARAAGSKSVGLFVRQKLIATLGLAAPRTGATEDEAPDLKQLTGELRRLHRELQIFVADSLSNSDYTMSSIQPIPFPTAVPENFLAEGAPLMPESVGYTYRAESNISIPFGEAPGSAYPYEESESQFSTAQTQLPFLAEYPKPQLPGQFPPDSVVANTQATNQQVSTQPSITQARIPQTTDLQAPSGIPPANTEPQSNQGIQPAYSIAPDPDASSYAIPNPATMQPAFSVPEAPPETPRFAAQPAMPIPAPTQPSVPFGQSFAENDELEDLAERAFAISPRLGQLDEAVKRFPDPLKDLLEDALINGLDEEEEEVLESNSEAQEEQEESPATETQTEDQAEDVENFESDQSESGPSEETIEEETASHDSEPETLEETEDKANDPVADTDPPPQQPPPISGGPPPRKHRT